MATDPALEALFQQAMAAQAAGDYATAGRALAAALAQFPESIQTRHNHAALLRAVGRLEEARDDLRRVLARDPSQAGSRYALGMVLMSLGDYPGGWPLYEARRDLPDLRIVVPTLPFPEWRGEDLAGKRLVVFPEQGLGDSIQFARFALVLRDRGARVLLLCQPPLASLFAGSLDRIEVRSAHGAVNLGKPDYWALSASLPRPLGVTVETIPAAPYLRAPAPASRQPGQGLRIGLATRGNPAHQNDRRRSLGPGEVARLHALPAQIVSLHPEDSGARDFADTADIIAGLDLVISVDTSVAHLAGALGAPGLVLLPGFATDWRWLRGRDDSPWYPSLRLARARVDGDWSTALDGVEAWVGELTAGLKPPT